MYHLALHPNQLYLALYHLHRQAQLHHLVNHSVRSPAQAGVQKALPAAVQVQALHHPPLNPAQVGVRKQAKVPQVPAAKAYRHPAYRRLQPPVVLESIGSQNMPMSQKSRKMGRINDTYTS